MSIISSPIPSIKMMDKMSDGLLFKAKGGILKQITWFEVCYEVFISNYKYHYSLRC